MAEVLGVVASSVALVDMAMKLASGLFALKELWAQVKDVPDTIECLMTEIEILLPLVQINSFDGCDAAKSYAFKAIRQLVNLVSDLTNDIGSARGYRRHLAKVRIALKADLFSKYENRLQSAVRLLMMAQQCYAISLQRSQADAVVKLLDALPSQSSSCSSPSNSIQGLDSLLSHPLSVGCRKSTAEYKATSRATWYIPFSGHLFHMKRSYCGWQFSLRPYTIFDPRRRWEPLQLIREGNAEGLFRLFEARRASPFDKTPCGKTYLYFASLCSSPAIAQRLIEMGVDPYEKDENGINFFNIDVMTLQGSPKDSSIRFFLFAVDQGLDKDGSIYLARAMSSDPSLFTTYIDTQTRRQVYTKRSIFEAGIHGLFYYGRPSQVRYMLEQAEKYSGSHSFKPNPCHFYPLYRDIIRGYSERLNRQFEKPPGTIEEWRKLLHEVIPLRSIQKWALKPEYNRFHWTSPLSTFLFAMLERGNQVQKLYTNATQVWVKEVYEYSGTLHEYGKLEQEHYDMYRFYCHRDPHDKYEEWCMANLEDSCWRPWVETHALHVGPLPEDWYFEWDPQVEKFVGDFFYLVEDPEWNRRLPGAWPER